MRTKKAQNMALSCKVKVFLNKKRQKVAKIIEYAENYLAKFSLNYSSDILRLDEKKNSDKCYIKLENSELVSDKISGGGIYFIFSQDNELLYIGKDKNLKNRLSQHLISCSTSTSSHIKDVHKYLLDCKKQSKSLTIKYSVINTVNDKDNAAIECLLIDYCLNNGEKSYDKLWNKRED